MFGMQGGFKGIQWGGLVDVVDIQLQIGYVVFGGGMIGEDYLQCVVECWDMGGYFIGRQSGGYLYWE